MKTVKYQGEECHVELGEYGNGQKAIQLLSNEDGLWELYIVPTVALDYPIGENEVAIKNWSENTGIYEFLVAEGVISKVKYTVPTGMVEALVCDLLI